MNFLKALLSGITEKVGTDSVSTKCSNPPCKKIITLPPGVMDGNVVKREYRGSLVGDAYISQNGYAYCSRVCHMEMTD